MAYTSDKKPGALTQASVLANTDNVVVEQSGDVKRATLSQVEAKIFDSKTDESTPTGTEVVVVRKTDSTLRQVALSDIVPTGNITNAKVSASAGIVDTKLATIATAGKVSNSATTAASANTPNAIVARDGSGNFVAGTITATLAGNITGNAATANSATTATTLATGRTIALTGDVTGTTGAFNGSAPVSAATTIANNAVTTAKIADLAVATAKIANLAVATAKIADGAITAVKIGDGEVSNTKIGDGQVTDAKVNAAANISGSKINPNFGSQAVTTIGNITGSKLIPTGNSAAGNGLYLPTTNTLALSTAGSERLRLHSDGSVSIGSSTAAERLHVTGGDIRVDRNANTDGALVFGAASTYIYGNAVDKVVGIGTDSFPRLIVNNLGAAITGDAVISANCYAANYFGNILTALPSGFPVRVQQTVKSDIQSVDTGVSDWADVTGLAITWTRTFLFDPNAKVRIQAVISCSTSNGNHPIAFRIVRDNSVIGVGNADGNRLQITSAGGYTGAYDLVSCAIDFIDTPGINNGSSYKIQARVYSAGVIGYINRPQTDTNVGDFQYRAISTMTLTELK